MADFKGLPDAEMLAFIGSNPIAREGELLALCRELAKALRDFIAYWDSRPAIIDGGKLSAQINAERQAKFNTVLAEARDLLAHTGLGGDDGA